MMAKGSILQLPKNLRPGYILSDEGRLVVFDEASLQGLDPTGLFPGDWVEYEELDRHERRGAFRIKPMIRRAEE